MRRMEIIPAREERDGPRLRIVPERPLILRPGDRAEFRMRLGIGERGEVLVWRAGRARRWWTIVKAWARGAHGPDVRAAGVETREP